MLATQWEADHETRYPKLAREARRPLGRGSSVGTAEKATPMSKPRPKASRVLMVWSADLKPPADETAPHTVEVWLLRRRPRPREFNSRWIEFREVRRGK